jgi:hypothetical protein
MTGLCTGGTSGVKAGFATVVDYSAGLIFNLLAAKNLKILAPILPLVNVPTLTLASFCSADPPTMPTFTLAETDAVLKLQFGSDFDSGISKIKDLILNAIWFDACECTSGTPVAFPTPTIPTDTPAFQPPLPPIIPPCVPLLTETHALIPGGFLNFTSVSILGANATMVVMHSSNSGGDSISSATRTVYAVSPTGTNTFLGSWNAVANAAIPEKRLAIPAGTDHILWGIQEAGHTGVSHNFVDTIEIWCSGGTPEGTSALPCCPPDESTQSYLDLILNMVTLMQRQTAPFAYVYGANHTGLTGDGELAVSGLLGVSVDVTAVGSEVGSRAGTPQHLFDVGYVTLGTPDGWLASRSIDADGALELARPGVGAITRVGYTLNSGVVVGIRELIREP